MAFTNALTLPVPPERHRAEARVRTLGRGLFSALLVFLALGCGHDVIDLAVPNIRDSGTDARDAASNEPTIACASNEDCATVGGVCAVDRGRCVECTQNTDCPIWRGLCDTTTNVCVQCLDSSQCPSGLSCDAEIRACVLPCTMDADCFGPVPICDEARGACVQCETDTQCEQQPIIGSRARICSYGFCIECLQDADCPFSAPHCLESGRCVECVQSSECGFGYECDPFDGHCRPTQ